MPGSHDRPPWITRSVRCSTLRSRRVIPGLVLLLAAAGCSNTPPDGHRFREYVENGVEVAENSGGPRFADDLFTYEELVTLQQDTSHPESLIYHSGRPLFPWDEKGFFVDEQGRYFIRDRGNYRIAVFDPVGCYERSIGRQGQGPGELSDAFDMIDLSGGILEVYDVAMSRTSWFATDGGFIRSVRGRGWPVPGQDAFLRIAEAGEYDVDQNLSLCAGFLAATAQGDTLGFIQTEQVRHKYAFASPAGGRGGMSRPDLPFTSRPVTRLLTDGSVILTTGIEPVLHWYCIDGSLQKRIVLGFPPRPVTAADRQAFIADLESRMASAEGVEREHLAQMRDAVPFPEYRTFCSYIFLDDKGYLWLEVYEEAYERAARGGVLYHVLSPGGEYLGDTRAPAVGRVMRDRLLGQVTDPQSGQEEFLVWRLTSRIEDFRYR